MEPNAILADAEIAQKSIIKWAMDTVHHNGTDFVRSHDYLDVKPLFEILPPTYFGRFSKIAEWIGKNWPEYTSDFAHYLQKTWANKEHLEIIGEIAFCSSPHKEAKILARIALGNASATSDPIETLKKYEKAVEKIEELRIGSAERQISGMSVFTELYEEIAERHDKGDFDALSGYSTGFPDLDRLTDGLRKWTVTRLNAYANTGKSKFSYQLTNNLLKQWAKVLYISLEVGRREVALNLCAHWYSLPYYDLAKGRTIPDFGQYPIDSLLVADKVRTMDEIETMVAKIKPDCVIIDYVQKIRLKQSATETERMSEIANRIQDMAVLNDVMVFDLSQVPNEWKNYVAGWVIPSKGSGDLVSAADVAFVMNRSNVKEKFIEFHLAKNKFGQNGKSFYLFPNFPKSSFEINGEIGWSVL